MLSLYAVKDFASLTQRFPGTEGSGVWLRAIGRFEVTASIDWEFEPVIYYLEMGMTFRKESSPKRWAVFISVAMCIAAVGVSSYFYERQRKEKNKRVAAEERLMSLRSELRLLEDKNRELAEQLLQAKRIAEELASERERLSTARVEASPEVEATSVELAHGEEAPVKPEEVARLRDAMDSLRLERVVAGSNRVAASAGNAWRTLRQAILSSARAAKAPTGSEVMEVPRPDLTEVMKAFPSAEFARVGALARDSLRKGLGMLGSMVSSMAESPTASAPPVLADNPPAPPGRLIATNEELRKELEDVRQEKRELEREIAERTGEIPGAVDVGKVRITTGRRFSGKVLVVNQKYHFVVIDIGMNQGLEKGEVLIVHRGSQFVGKVQVTKVYEKMAAADLVMSWMQDDVQVNDGVKKF